MALDDFCSLMKSSSKFLSSVASFEKTKQLSKTLTGVLATLTSFVSDFLLQIFDRFYHILSWLSNCTLKNYPYWTKKARFNGAGSLWGCFTISWTSHHIWDVQLIEAYAFFCFSEEFLSGLSLSGVEISSSTNLSVIFWKNKKATNKPIMRAPHQTQHTPITPPDLLIASMITFELLIKDKEIMDSK